VVLGGNAAAPLLALHRRLPRVRDLAGAVRLAHERWRIHSMAIHYTCSTATSGSTTVGWFQ
jgi:hypothetical protein